MSLRSVKKILKQRGELDNLSRSNSELFPGGSESEEEEEDLIYYEKTESKQNIFDLVSLLNKFLNYIFYFVSI